MRAITDWYFTAHPPIMHDLHESQPLLYTYSGAAPQNPEPRSDPVRRAAVLLELRARADDEVGHAGRLHARLHGRLVAGLSGIGRLQPQRHDADVRDAGRHRHHAARRAGHVDAVHRAAAPRDVAARRRWVRAGTRRHSRAGRSAAPAAASSRPSTGTRRRLPDAGGRGRGAAPATWRSGGAGAEAHGWPRRGDWTAPTGRGGGQPREWYRGLPIPPGALNNWSRRNNANYMQTGVLSGLQLTSMIPNLVLENFYQKTRNSIESGKTDPPFGFVIPVQRDMTRVAELLSILRAQGIEIGSTTAEISVSRRQIPGRLVRDQARSALRPARQEPAGAPELSGSQPPHLRRQRLDDGAGDAGGRPRDQGQGDPRRRRPLR